MQATGGAASIHFVMIVVIGSLFLFEYTVAILCMTFVEVRPTPLSTEHGTHKSRGLLCSHVLASTEI